MVLIPPPPRKPFNTSDSPEMGVTPLDLVNFINAIAGNLNASIDPGPSNDSTQGFQPGSLWFNSLTGRLFINRSAAAGVAIWRLVVSDSHPGYVAGHWYTCSDGMQSTLNAGAANANNGTIRLYLFNLRERCTVEALGGCVTTLSAGGNAQMAIYANNPTTMRPTGAPLASTASMSVAATGSINGAVNVQLEPGFYWVGTNTDNATCALVSFNAIMGAGALIGSATQNLSMGNQAGITGVSVASAFGTWPNMTSASFTEVQSNTTPVVQFQVGSVP